MQQISDDEVMGQDEGLRNNLRSVYLQSETTTGNVKVQCAFRGEIYLS